MQGSKHRRKGFKLSFIISSVVLLSVIMTLLINFFTAYQIEKSSLYNNTLDLNRIHSNELSRTAQTIILSMKQTVRGTALFFANENVSDAAAQKQLDFLMSTDNFFSSLALVDESGILRSISPSNKGIIGQKLSSLPSQQALETQKPTMSQPYRAITNRLIVLISYPIKDVNGNYKGFIAGTIYLQEPNGLQKILGEQSENTNGSYFYVVDAAGNLIFHPNLERVGEHVVANKVVQKLIAGESGQQEVTNTEGVRYLAGFSVVPEVGWGIVSQTPVSYVDKNANRLISTMALYSLPLLIVVLGVVLWISGKLARPLNRLAHISSRMNINESVYIKIPEIEHWNYEANELYKAIAQAFNVMRKRTEELSFEAHTDPLTGLTNRRSMDSILSMWLDHSINFSIIMLDLDHFKAVNDTYGHQMGDEVLKFTAGLMQDEKREHDICCRYGGEEFTMLLPYTTEEEAFLLAERIRSRIEQLDSPIGRKVTLSLGVSSYPHSAQDLHSLFKNADDALYEAKNNGRNQTVLYQNKRKLSS
jgi:diguanylate cyclase (GGDEF)-like protein